MAVGSGFSAVVWYVVLRKFALLICGRPVELCVHPPFLSTLKKLYVCVVYCVLYVCVVCYVCSVCCVCVVVCVVEFPGLQLG